ncbi:hypothetical protein BaRGS_00033022, partial [Batillaria attramentaria]
SDSVVDCGWRSPDPEASAIKGGEEAVIQIPPASSAQQSYSPRMACHWNFVRIPRHVKMTFKFT